MRIRSTQAQAPTGLGRAPPPLSRPARAECIGTQQQLLEQVRLLLFLLWFDPYFRPSPL